MSKTGHRESMYSREGEPTTPAPMTAERLEEIRKDLAPETCGYWTGHSLELLAHIDAITARIAELERDNKKMKTTYLQPSHGWVCFHCGETFTKPGEARYHFGETPHGAPGCVIKVGEERGLLMALRKAEAELAAARKPPEDGEVAGVVSYLRSLGEGPNGAIMLAKAADLLTRLTAALREAERRADKEADLRQGVEEAADELTEAWKRRAVAAEAKLTEMTRRDVLEEAAKTCEYLRDAEFSKLPHYTDEPDFSTEDVCAETVCAWHIRALKQKNTAP